jgi:hypothetical protein
LRDSRRLACEAADGRRRCLGCGLVSVEIMRLTVFLIVWNIGGLPLEGEFGGLKCGPNADH